MRPVVFIGHHVDVFQNLEVKNHGAHHLDSIIGHPEHLHHARNAFWHLDAKNYGAHVLDSIIGHSKHLDHARNAFWHLDAKNYEAHYLDFVIAHSDVDANNYNLLFKSPSYVYNNIISIIVRCLLT